jgi:hypothetical protein
MKSAFAQVSNGPGRRVSLGKAPPPLPKTPTPKFVNYGIIEEHFAGPFRACKTEIDQAKWIYQNHHRFVGFYKAGKDLINKYEHLWPTW